MRRLSNCFKMIMFIEMLTADDKFWSSASNVSANSAVGLPTALTAAGESSVCNPGIPNPGIPTVFANPESRYWQRLNPEITGLRKFVKMYFFECQMTQITILAL